MITLRIADLNRSLRVSAYVITKPISTKNNLFFQKYFSKFMPRRKKIFIKCRRSQK
ncbi:hypothetical protein LEP1GSC058_2672 [Leptospira fainei serovar Hurstbridge str. BUT 6]|uniref:Uncharacterized protein n=1 Tax=Leptospira fainei serovar Hurstbridge str. BUT 6 TaxID=1193011 RepID=S3US95_9LEPT|nr:hypothetical protein LEP1GSC058_2672 [Leptospira fainei serovar Hurstbridge str. BUT 6]